MGDIEDRIVGSKIAPNVIQRIDYRAGTPIVDESPVHIAGDGAILPCLVEAENLVDLSPAQRSCNIAMDEEGIDVAGHAE